MEATKKIPVWKRMDKQNWSIITHLPWGEAMRLIKVRRVEKYLWARHLRKYNIRPPVGVVVGHHALMYFNSQQLTAIMEGLASPVGYNGFQRIDTY